MKSKIKKNAVVSIFLLFPKSASLTWIKFIKLIDQIEMLLAKQAFQFNHSSMILLLKIS